MVQGGCAETSEFLDCMFDAQLRLQDGPIRALCEYRRDSIRFTNQRLMLRLFRSLDPAPPKEPCYAQEVAMPVKPLLSASITRSATVAMALLAFVSTAPSVRADMVTDWNVIAL